MQSYKITDPAEQAVVPGPPAHPGGWIKSVVIEGHGLTVADAARRMGFNRPTLHRMLKGDYALSRDLAYRLEALTGVDAELMIAMQARYDLAQDEAVRARYAREIARVAAPAETEA